MRTCGPDEHDGFAVDMEKAVKWVNAWAGDGRTSATIAENRTPVNSQNEEAGF
jgi:hypothetical protein